MQFLFQPNGLAWKLLQENPDRYIYEAVLKGVDIPLPDAIAIGISDISKRDGWNLSAAREFSLPTETWREHIARRTRCLELRQKLASGEIQSVNDLVTYNLNIRQLAQHVIENCYEPELLWAFYQAISKITVLDPTCGSGAFLLSALNILEPLYDACLEQMQIFLDEDFIPNNENSIQIFNNFRQILKQVDLHSNRRYFILKSIVINNLYGVDIMQEATEICKLRLFLKLSAQIEPNTSKPNNGIEPLPDIDFNIRAGNTLVGFANYNEVKKAIEGDEQKNIDLFKDMDRINKKAQIVAQTFQDFHELQIRDRIDGGAIALKKVELCCQSQELRNELDRYLADEYETGKSEKPLIFKEWRQSHQPFHWFVEFYSIICNGGFDVIIGNPPYVEYSKVRQNYKVLHFELEECGNLYAYVVERCIKILKQNRHLGLVIPISSFSTERAKKMQELWKNHISHSWLSHFGVCPARLFSGAAQRVTIAIGQKGNEDLSVYSTRYLRWKSKERDELFNSLVYCDSNSSEYIKTGFQLTNNICSKLQGEAIKNIFCSQGIHSFYWHRIPQYFIKAIDFEPYFYSNRDGNKLSDDYKVFKTKHEVDKLCAMAYLNSSLAYWYWMVCSEGYHFGKHEVFALPANINNLSSVHCQTLTRIVKTLMADYQKNLVRRPRNQRSTHIEYDEFRQKLSKSIIDEIDRVLAQHHGFTDEELDFVINYDIKYRMGQELESED